MSKQTWFTADTHFGHANIVRSSARPFTSIEEHDEALVDNWNASVSPGDDVFHLGDFAFRNKTSAAAYRWRLHGNIHLIEGNHDAAAHHIRDSFVWYEQLHSIKVNDQAIVLCHYAMRIWHKSHHGAWHLYGHSHFSLPDDPNARSLDVGVDAVAGRLANLPAGTAITPGLTRPQDYRPTNFDEVAALMARKTFTPIDHHGNQHATPNV
jgi:calcineurin-like phosphoesterase family protein